VKEREREKAGSVVALQGQLLDINDEKRSWGV